MWIVRDFSRINRQIYLQRETWRGRKFKEEIYCASVVRDIIWTVSFHLPLLHCKLPATQRWTTTLPRRIRSLSFATDHRRRLFRWKVNRVRKTSSSSSSTSKSARQTLPIPTPPPTHHHAVSAKWERVLFTIAHWMDSPNVLILYRRRRRRVTVESKSQSCAVVVFVQCQCHDSAIYQCPSRTKGVLTRAQLIDSPV